MKLYDIHCHILPGLDDGAFFQDESFMMAELAAAHSTGCIVCTPHRYPDNRYGLEELADAFVKLEEAVQVSGLGIELLLGQEIYFDEDCRETLSLLRSGRLLTLNKTVYPLIEFDFEIRDRLALGIVREVASFGLTPIVAHPERYAFVHEDTDNLYRLKREGALLQLNKGSIAGSFGRKSAYVADVMLRERIADLAASDAHSPYRRTPVLDEFHLWMCEEVSENYADFLLCANPRHIVKNEKTDSYH